ncbi:MAG TPA: glycosyltransferase family 2 protein [Candidatus Blautia merdavium]|uniref:Glycosyltransferase family 2 protein n=1 Tax=Candidatus Blautia merdavium TaxID=2838494 RepID=A0A9D2PSN1_9FIRM|nr:glycosyltransferase family 2 protein [Candidatus Blautia merdavium]
MCEVSVIIPNYNGKQYLKTCLDALRTQTSRNFKTILVDNGSQDGSREYVQEQYPEVKIVALKENTGFCGAVNAGIRVSASPYVLLLNNDTQAEPEFVENLTKAVKKRKNCFSVQAKMLQMHDKTRMDDAGNAYCAFGWAFAEGKGRPETEYCTERQIFSSCAGAAIYRREILDKIGLFDEEHFAYLEDLDICYRARLRGYENWFCPSARVLHVGSGTSGSRYNLFKVRYSSRNNIYLAYKNMPLAQLIWNFPLLLLGFAAKALFFTSKGYGGEYIRGLKNGIQISVKNRDKKVRKVPPGTCLKIQLELYKNMIKKLTS